MSAVEVNDVSIGYMTGDFKNIGLKEYVTRKLTGNYEVTQSSHEDDILVKLKEKAA